MKVDKGIFSEIKPPTHIYVEVTNNCQLRCIMCRYGEDILCENMSMDTLINALPLIAHADTIIMAGWGEPTTHPRYLDMLKLVRKNNRYANIHFITHMNNFDDQIMSFMIENPPTSLMVSIDAATKETYEKIRVNGSWEKLNQNLSTLSKMMDEKGSIYPKIQFNTVIQKDNICELDAIIDHINHLIKPDSITLTSLVDRPQLDINYEDNIQYITNALQAIKKYKTPVGGSGYTKMLAAVGKDLKLGEISDNRANVSPLMRCTEPFKKMYLSLDGTIFACCYKKHDLGNINNKNIGEIWHSNGYSQLRESMHNGKLDEKCAECISKKDNNQEI